MLLSRILACSLALAAARPAPAGPAPDRQPEGDGDVRLPLATYSQLIDRGREAPVGWAMGPSQVSVAVGESEPGGQTVVRVRLTVQTLSQGWALVPLLPATAALLSANVDGTPVALVPGPEGLSWSARGEGSHEIDLSYAVEPIRSAGGYTLTVPIPRASTTRLSATLPGTRLDVSVVPASGVSLGESASATTVSASLPPTGLVQIAWQAPVARGHALSRAVYRGELAGSSVGWSATFRAELFAGQATIALFPAEVTLADLQVDGRPATVVIENGRLAVLVSGKGVHEVSARFASAVVTADGPPSVHLALLPVPLTRLELRLPGKKELGVEPAAPVSRIERNGATELSLSLPMTAAATLSWSEAVPAAAGVEPVSANASLYHLARAEEGVLGVRIRALWEIARGETASLSLLLPAGVQVNKVSSPGGAVADWRLVPADGGKGSRLSVFLDRKVKGELRLDIDGERLFQDGERMVVPLARAEGVHRQRGMVALLASSELTLRPLSERGLNRVGDNQLPAEVREAAQATVAHTYKYAEGEPELVVEAVAPERKPAVFEAQVDTLLSIGEVAVRGAATIELDIKSGSLMELALGLPAGLNLLSVAAPSLRAWEVQAGESGQTVAVAFTQEMDGRFRLELGYERLLGDGESGLELQAVTVGGAAAEHGRIAVEALSAVEVAATAVEGLSPTDVSELPQQLVLKTTNPILLAYKYTRPSPRLGLKLTRHREIEVPAATVDLAHYRTLYTRDGLAVTVARLEVRNVRKPFLQVELPAGSTVWSVVVAGKAEKPAAAAEGKEGKDKDGTGAVTVLVRLLNRAEGFPVELVYATRVAPFGWVGRVEGQLPRLDLVVTRSRWDVYLPDGFSYGRPRTDMDVVALGRKVGREALGEELGRSIDESARPQAAALLLDVPAQGLQFSFEKLYASETRGETGFAMRYSSRLGAGIGTRLSVVATGLGWAALAVLLGLRPIWLGRRLAIALLAAGWSLALALVVVAGANPWAPVVTSLLALAVWLLRALRERHRGGPAVSAPVEGSL